jgi:hypothetical protein
MLFDLASDEIPPAFATRYAALVRGNEHREIWAKSLTDVLLKHESDGVFLPDVANEDARLSMLSAMSQISQRPSVVI